jgi:hypothetical protein
MSQIYEYTGVVEEVGSTQQIGTNGFTKREIVIGNDVDSTSKWPNPVKFTFKKDNCQLLDSVKKGVRAKVRFAIDGRRWDDPKTGTAKYFTDLTGLRIEVINNDGSSTEPIPAPAEYDGAGADDIDTMPF